MKDLYVSKEMQQFQDSARRQWAENKLDVSAVIIGWKLDTGRVLHSEKTTVTLLDMPAPHITKVVKIEMNGENKETSIDTIARLILSNQVTVYHSA